MMKGKFGKITKSFKVLWKLERSELLNTFCHTLKKEYSNLTIALSSCFVKFFFYIFRQKIKRRKRVKRQKLIDADFYWHHLIQFVFIVCQVKGYRVTLKLRLWRLVFTSYKAVLKNKQRIGTCLSTSFSA